EDVVLWRALKDVERGFYVDVGANDPVVDSVTKAFYDRGWAGINLEPLQRHFDDLCRDRPRDINLQVAVGASEGELVLWDSEVRGWASACCKVQQAQLEHGTEGVAVTVQQTTLSKVLSDHHDGDIHFLKIDVEGLEKEVLEGTDFQRFRPWIVVIEALIPN